MSGKGHGFAQPHDPRTGEKPPLVPMLRSEHEAMQRAITDLMAACEAARDHIARDDPAVPDEGVLGQCDEAIRQAEGLGLAAE